MSNAHQFVSFQATYRPEAVAIQLDDSSINFKEFAQISCDTALKLAKSGVAKGDRVCVLSDTCLHYVACYFSTAVTGFVLVPINVRYSVDEVIWLLQDSDPTLLIYDDKCSDLVQQIKAVYTSNNIKFCHWNELNDVILDDSDVLDPLVARYGGVNEDDVCAMIYTSGTTSKPKGAMLTHRNIVTNYTNYMVELGIDQNCSSILATPLFHIGGLGVINGAILAAGGSLRLMNRFGVDDLTEVLNKEQPSHLFLLSAMWVALTSSESAIQSRFANVRYVQTAASQLSQRRQEIIRAMFPNADFGWGFGMTETSPSTIKNRYSKEIADHPGSIGYLWRNVQARLVTAEGKIVPPLAATGDFEVRGPTVFKGYWRNPEANAETFTADGWLKTGDILRFDADGYAYFVGRSKDMIKSGGENVAAIEVETMILTDHRVKEVAVFGVPDERWGEAVVAAVVPLSADTITESEVISFCKQKLSSFKVPKRIVMVNELPKSSSGKIQKFKLAQLLGSKNQ